jgi:anti-sigma regulatory factor (Ser/Thr protein kinase)
METTGEETLALQIAAAPELIGGVRRRVAEHARSLSFDEDAVDALTLAVGEACSNAVCYGGAGFSDPQVVITCALPAPGRLQIDIRNQGNGFHPDLAALAVLPPSDALATHGRGFALMRALVDDVQVLSDGHNTTVRLTKLASHA